MRYILLALLLYAPVVYGQTAMDKALAQIEQNQPIDSTLIKQAGEENNFIAQETDRVLNMLLSIPFEQRQYIFPALFNHSNLPKKIRKHPEIAIWEGKVPTSIAPQAEEYAQKYLYDMKPEMYIYLSPDAYTPAKDSPKSPLSNLPNQEPFSFRVISNQQYTPLQNLIHLPEELQKNPNLSVLSEDRLKKIGQGMKNFNQTLNTLTQTDPTFGSGYRFLTLFRSNIYEDKVNPFQEQLNRIRILKKEPEFNIALKQAGFKSAEEFAVMADTTAKAYRVSSMPLFLSFENRRYRAEKPKTKLEEMSYTAARMYEALPQDVYLVIKNKEEIRQNFIENGYQSILNGISVDEWEK